MQRSRRRSRRSYLLNGRRVALSDLLDAGLLTPGDHLVFERTRGDRYDAHVTEDGQLLVPEGATYRTPSRAASDLTGVSCDGWECWRVAATGVLIDDLRQQLLEKVATEVAQTIRGQRDDEGVGEEEVNSALTRHRKLQELRRTAQVDGETNLTVRELLALWGAKSRESETVHMIESDLANHGLVTSPDFRMVGIDSEVSVKLTLEDLSSRPEEPGKSLDEEDGLQDIGLTVGTVSSAMGGVVAIKPDSDLEEAITVMLLNDFSQLPVMSNAYKVGGAVTWRSIATARHRLPDAKLHNATESVTEVSYTDDLIKILPLLKASEFVVVRGPKAQISGIVTATDVVTKYGELATPFFLIGEIDQQLRRLLYERINFDTIVGLCDPDGTRRLDGYDELTMGDYHRTLQNPACWELLNWPLDRVSFSERLEYVSKLRNNVMHFNPDPVPEDAVNKLLNFLELIKVYRD